MTAVGQFGWGYLFDVARQVRGFHGIPQVDPERKVSHNHDFSIQTQEIATLKGKSRLS